VPEVIAYGPHSAQYGELWRPQGPSVATVVVIHGGFWRGRYTASLGLPLAADLAARGYTAWNLEYRRVGGGGGRPATFDDVAAGIDRLADLGLDTSAVITLGHSAGGHLAVWAAGRPEPRVPVTGVLAQAGVLELGLAARTGVGGTAVVDLMGGAPEELPAEYAAADPSRAVPLSVPVICLHARADADVPFSQSANYVAAATAAGASARLVETPGDHFTMIDPTTSDWQLALAGLKELT
jgi:acetyl esterase/lipase